MIHLRLLVNAANLHVGGGLNVASSVIDEISRMEISAECTILVSSLVRANLEAMGTDLEAFQRVETHDQVRLKGLWAKLPIAVRDYDVVLNIFGPVYSPRLAWRSVMGFAQPWIAFPNNLATRRLSWVTRVQRRAKFALMAPWFLLADTLVVEQEAVREALLSRWLFKRKRVVVVSNTVDSIFADPDRWTKVKLPARDNALKLGIISRNYVHKNLGLLAEVRRVLREKFEVDSDIFVTLKAREWEDLPSSVKEELTNVGPLTIDQCPPFYLQLDAVVFPSLLECFSASPLEARVLGVPLFASDIPTVRETVGSYGVYFDPLDPDDAAQHIMRTLLAPGFTSNSENVGISEEGVLNGVVDGSKRRADSIVAECREVSRDRPPPKPLFGRFRFRGSCCWKGRKS